MSRHLSDASEVLTSAIEFPRRSRRASPPPAPRLRYRPDPMVLPPLTPLDTVEEGAPSTAFISVGMPGPACGAVQAISSGYVDLLDLKQEPKLPDRAETVRVTVGADRAPALPLRPCKVVRSESPPTPAMRPLPEPQNVTVQDIMLPECSPNSLSFNEMESESMDMNYEPTFVLPMQSLVEEAVAAICMSQIGYVPSRFDDNTSTCSTRAPSPCGARQAGH